MSHRLGDLAELIRGVSFDGSEASPKSRDGFVPILRAGNIADRLLLDDLLWVPEQRVSRTQLLKVGDVAICMSSGSASVVGKTALVDAPLNGAVGAFCAVVRPGSGVDPTYLALWFRSPAFWSWRDGQSRGANIQNLRLSALAEINVPLPPFDEQHRIAAQLTEQLAAVARARGAAQETFQAARALALSHLRAALEPSTDRGGWREVRLGEAVTIQLGKMLSPASKTGLRSIPYLRNANVQWDRLDLADVHEMDFDEKEERKYLLRAGDVLVCEGGEPGRAAVWHGEIKRCCYQKALHRLRPIDGAVDPQFLVYRLWLGGLTGEFVEDHAQTTIAHLPAIRLAELRVSLPDPEEQRQIAADLRQQLASVDSMIR